MSKFAQLSGYAQLMDTFDDLLSDWTTRANWVVGTNVEYAIAVHEGSARMEGRPYLAEAMDEVVRSKGDQLADRAATADELVELVALELEGETKRKITEMGAVDTGNLRSSISAREL